MLEYIIHSSSKLLFEFLTTPSGLSEWFADDVNINGNIFTFYWDGAKQEANLLDIKEGKSIRLRWTDRPVDTYFEFRIEQNELTEELSLIITDFAESEDDKNSLEVLWQGQVQRLMKVIGSKA
ncbi:MAG: SRPBCC domain-containing protein [Bacteroidetes bacterium]|nr:SRPBCC domain-containing protein [Bacteroidota bacterium]